MKTSIIFIFFASLIFMSCDKVKHPDTRPPVIPHCVDSTSMVVKTKSSTTRKVLLEDYTGHTCINCPRAAEAAESLTPKSSIIIIANHVSAFADPQSFNDPLNDTIYKENFQNTASTTWDKVSLGGFGMSSAGLPKGFVNRVGGPQNYGTWSGLVATALAKPWSAKLDVTTYYDTVSHYTNVKVKTTFITAWPNNVNLVVLFTQDSIVSDQKDGSPPPGAIMDPNGASRRLRYHFDNIVIESFNGAWGDLVKATPAANDTVTKSYGCFLLNKCFFTSSTKPNVCVKDKYVNVVAFLYDVVTKEVLQAEKLRIR
ncbi:MAG: Omp28-related outer membrane protein [Bacteroidetes bacterium]|nr:Omp28-related outer membrane protein [Bacteroidota bacterium]